MMESRFLVSNRRTDWAARTLARYFALLGEEEIGDIATEIGLDACLSYNAAGTGFNFEGTELQMISMAAAFAAVGEIREQAE